jgi:hypothetical protein
MPHKSSWITRVTTTYRKKKKGTSSYKYSQAMKDAKKTYKHKAKGRK